jgi:hypothetical protein
VDAVGPDQGIDAVRAAIGKADRHLVGIVGDSDRTLAGENDPRRQSGFERGEQVRAMDGELRSAVARLRGVRHCQPRRLLAGVPGPADAMGGAPRGGAQRPAHPEAVERAHRIGRQVDVGADAAEFRGLLEHHHVVAHRPQRDRRRQPTDAAAIDPYL